jgi:uncharacterized protein (TIGR00369 family)
MDATEKPMPVLEYLQRRIRGEIVAGDRTTLSYPTAISKLLQLEIVAVAERTASVRMAADPAIHGNQQGTVHGGTLAELADAAIGTAHSTVIAEGESFTTLELTVRFFRPVWQSTLTATATASHPGRSVSHYHCDIRDEQDRLIAVADSSVMTLRGASAVGR